MRIGINCYCVIRHLIAQKIGPKPFNAQSKDAIPTSAAPAYRSLVIQTLCLSCMACRGGHCEPGRVSEQGERYGQHSIAYWPELRWEEMYISAWWQEVRAWIWLEVFWLFVRFNLWLQLSVIWFWGFSGQRGKQLSFLYSVSRRWTMGQNNSGFPLSCFLFASSHSGPPLWVH